MIPPSRLTAVWMKPIDSAISTSTSGRACFRASAGTSSRSTTLSRSLPIIPSSLLNPWRLTRGERRSCETL